MARTTENTPLATNPAPTAQQVFDATWRRATENPTRNHRPGFGCVYRSADGTGACFVGELLTDEEAEGLDQRKPLTAEDLTREGLMPERLRPHTKLLQELQTVHDAHIDPRVWPERLTLVAKRHHLTVPV